MVFMSDIIKKAVSLGYEPITKGEQGRSVLLFQCPKCKRARMVKFRKKPDKRNVIHACTCGYRYMSPGFHKNNGTFHHLAQNLK